jgi:hypothetical protein
MNMSLIHEKFDHIKTPSKKKKQDGSCVSQKERGREEKVIKTDLQQLPPIQDVPGIVFKNKSIIYFSL